MLYINVYHIEFWLDCACVHARNPVNYCNLSTSTSCIQVHYSTHCVQVPPVRPQVRQGRPRKADDERDELIVDRHLISSSQLDSGCYPTLTVISTFVTEVMRLDLPPNLHGPFRPKIGPSEHFGPGASNAAATVSISVVFRLYSRMHGHEPIPIHY